MFNNKKQFLHEGKKIIELYSHGHPVECRDTEVVPIIIHILPNTWIIYALYTYLLYQTCIGQTLQNYVDVF